jgi:phage terminase small subunit
MAKTKRVKQGTSKASAADRHQMFVDAFIRNGRNATQAAIAAGYSPRTARQQGARLLTDVSVCAGITKRSEKLAEKYELTTESVIAELSKIVHADPRKMFDADGCLLHPKNWPDELAGVIASVEVTEEFSGRGESRELVGYTKKVKLWDKNSAIDKAMKHLGLFAEDNKQRGSALSDLPREMVKAIVERLRQLNGQSARLD